MREIVGRTGFLLGVATAVLALVPAAASGDMVVRTIIVAGRSVPKTDRVRLARFADLREEGFLALNTRLGVGDLITSTAQDVLVELTCVRPPGATPAADAGGQPPGSPEGTPFRLSSGFRAVVLPATAQAPCVLELLSGGVDVETDEPTVVNAAGIVLGTRGTTFAVRLRRTPQGVVCDGVVFEGLLDLNPPQRTTVVLEQGRAWQWNVTASAGKQAPVADDVLRESARVHTLFDLAAVNPAVFTTTSVTERRAAGQKLFTSRAAVLREPTNLEARVGLAAAQSAVGLTRNASLQLRKVEMMKSKVPKE